ncbi:MAG TPA: hypothetical protein VFZ27_11615 [Terriglobia bacterium]|nr:hypothetical protein [Terriglobia bacterium]
MILSAKLVQMIEYHAEELTRGVIHDLKTNPKTPSLHQLSGAELHDQSYDVYHSLSRWLTQLSEDSIKDFHYKLAEIRLTEGIPLNEVIYALILKKYHLRDFIRTSGMVDSAVELLQEQELHHLIGSFFDKAIFFTAKRYEEASRAEAAEGVREPAHRGVRSL